MPRPSSLSAYPAASLHAVRCAVAALLRYQDMLPTDLSTKLDLFRGDVNQALRPTPGPAPIFVPRPAALPRPLPGQGAAAHQQAPRHPGAPPDTLPPERRLP
jgi:hypothetical protein